MFSDMFYRNPVPWDECVSQNYVLQKVYLLTWFTESMFTYMFDRKYISLHVLHKSGGSLTCMLEQNYVLQIASLSFFIAILVLELVPTVNK